MILSATASPFTNQASVEAWDAWFRWREGTVLRDTSIETTWQRVATALASSEAGDRAHWARRFFDAQAGWQLVLDESILATAGTPHARWPDEPAALLNVASFVAAPFSPDAYFEFDALHEVAQLALRAADNALLARRDGGRDRCRPRIGLIGMADALALLGKRYDSGAGRVLAGRIAQTLALGCLSENVRLARERFPWRRHGDAALVRAQVRGTPRELLEQIRRHGVRHEQCTAIGAQRRLALFANQVCDALDPLAGSDNAGVVEEPDGIGASRTRGYALALARRAASAAAISVISEAVCGISIPAQIDLRGAVQPWIDAPIDYPFRVSRVPGGRAATRWQHLAAAYRLGDPRWSTNDETVPAGAHARAHAASPLRTSIH